VNIRFKQGEADITQGVEDTLLGQDSSPLKLLKNGVKLFGQNFKHLDVSSPKTQNLHKFI
jgi:hypothetical protein